MRMPSPTKFAERIGLFDRWFAFKKKTKVLIWIERLFGMDKRCLEEKNDEG